MCAATLCAEELLAGSTLLHEAAVPTGLLGKEIGKSGSVVLRPLTVADLQRIAKAAREDDNLAATLMIQQGMAEPKLSAVEAAQLPAGLAHFLVEQISAISGIAMPRNTLQEMVQTPLARACFRLAKEFGWTPEEVSGLTIGQILMYLELSREQSEAE